ncbi:hypothetical protein D3C72_2247170 [compost metagenome]
MTGAADRHDLFGADTGALDALADDCPGMGPQLFEPPLDMPGPRNPAVPLLRSRRDLVALKVENHRLDDGVSGVESQKIVCH